MRILFIVLLGLLIGSASFGATRRAVKVKKTVINEDSVKVSLPDAHLESSTAKVEEPVAYWHPRLEVVVSSWSPRDLENASIIDGASPWQVSGMPYFSAGVLINPWDTGFASQLAFKLGLGFASLTRQATLQYLSTSEIVNQGAYLIPVQAGVEYSPSVLTWKNVSGHLGVFVMPTMLLTQRSAMDDGTSSVGVPFQMTLGSQIDLKKWVSIPMQLTVDWVATYGGIRGGGNLFGTGIGAGIRTAL